MKTFKISYIKPDTEELVTEIKSFNDSKEGSLFISAAEWAEDYAYTVSNKGCYTITERSKFDQGA